jgi:hypothetical protein
MCCYRTLLLFSTLLVLSSCNHDGDPPSSTLCESAQYGVSTSLPDNTAVFQAALLSCQGRTMHVSAGTYKFSPALAYPHTNGLGNGISIPDRTSILGDGAGQTILRVVGTGNYAYFFWVRNAGDLSIRNLTLMGNNAHNPSPPPGEPDCFYDYGHAVFIQSTNRPIGNISISQSDFISFTGSSWISILAADSSNRIGAIDQPITIEGNYFKSIPGNSQAPQAIVCPSSAVAIQGLGPIASASNLTVARNTFDVEYIKSAVAIWSGAVHITVVNNRINSAGQGLPLPVNYSNGSYAIFVYQQHAVPPDTSTYVRPTDVQLIGNIIVNPYSSGIYVAGGQSISIVDNVISGQVDTFDGTEPRAAIAINTINNDFAGIESPVSNNYIATSAIGMSFAGATLPVVDSNVIDLIPTKGIGIKVSGKRINGTTLNLTNTFVAAADDAINVSSMVGFFPLNGLTIDGLYQVGATLPLRWYTDIVGTPQHPQNAYCSFHAFGSVSGVYINVPSCANFGECWRTQGGYWPKYGARCLPNT